MKNLAVGDLVCDYATPKDEAAIVAAGYKAVARYITGSPTDWREISPAELRRIVDHGLGLWLIWETGASRALSGAAGGKADGAVARKEADRLGYDGSIVIATTDFDVTGASIGAVMEYCRAFKVACGLPCGIYADTDIAAACAPGEFGPLWRPAAAWWSRQGSNTAFVHPNTDIKQGFTGERVPGVDHGVVVKPVSVWTGKAAPVVALPKVPKAWLVKGDSGPEVKFLQGQVNFWGALAPQKYSCGPADGFFGDATVAGVKAFQKTLKQWPDGRYGPETEKAYAYFLAAMNALAAKK